jgi:hypothetical protein
LLIAKGRDKYPRLISVPTIRDRITLGLLKETLHEMCSDRLKHKLVQSIVSEVITNIPRYNSYVKIDVTNFYGSINHEILMTKLTNFTNDARIHDLVLKAIRTRTVPEGEPSDIKPSTEGIPQGLPISNLLSSIFMNDFDIKHLQSRSYKYFRYVDDILILCPEEDCEVIKNAITNELETSYLLSAHPNKTCVRKLSDGLEYLGYTFTGSKVSVRESSVLKIQKSLENLFLEFRKTKNINLFLWKLNLRITGCFYGRKKYGWLFFFSQVTDLVILFKLDWFVQRLIIRFDMKEELNGKSIKRLVKTYHEILNNRNNTSYIPRFSNYTLSQKRGFLENVHKVDVTGWESDLIEDLFDRKIITYINELELDIQTFS